MSEKEKKHVVVVCTQKKKYGQIFTYDSFKESFPEYEKPATENQDLHNAENLTVMLHRMSANTSKALRAEKKMGFGRDYPGHPMLDDDFSLNKAERAALEKFKDKKPYRASNEDYLNMIQELYCDLAEAHGSTPPIVRHSGEWENAKYPSFYTPHMVVLTGSKNVTTALHEYMHSLGYGEVSAVWWSTNAFKLLYPSSFKNLEVNPDFPHLMRRIRIKEKQEVEEFENREEESPAAAPGFLGFASK